MTEFRATTSTTQAITANTETELNFGTENFDTDTAFASGRFTVPASWNGRYAELFSSVRLASGGSGWIGIEVSTTGGSTWAWAARTTFSLTSNSPVATGPLLMATGDIYRATLNTIASSTVSDEERTFFSGLLTNPVTNPTLKEYFRAHAASTQAISNNTLTPITLGTEDFDVGTNFASNVYTVPADLNGGYGVFTVGISQDTPDSTENIFSYVTKSTDGGSTFPTAVATKGSDETEGTTTTTGVVALVTGDKYRAETFTNTGGYTIAASVGSFMAGQLYKV